MHLAVALKDAIIGEEIRRGAAAVVIDIVPVADGQLVKLGGDGKAFLGSVKHESLSFGTR